MKKMGRKNHRKLRIRDDNSKSQDSNGNERLLYLGVSFVLLLSIVIYNISMEEDNSSHQKITPSHQETLHQASPRDTTPQETPHRDTLYQASPQDTLHQTSHQETTPQETIHQTSHQDTLHQTSHQNTLHQTSHQETLHQTSHRDTLHQASPQETTLYNLPKTTTIIRLHTPPSNHPPTTAIKYIETGNRKTLVECLEKLAASHMKSYNLVKDRFRASNWDVYAPGGSTSDWVRDVKGLLSLSSNSIRLLPM